MCWGEGDWLMAQVTYTDSATLNCLFVSKLGSCWGISGRRVGEPGRKALWDLVFPQKPEYKERMEGNSAQDIVFSL